MNTPHTKNIQKEKKTHPFLFLFFLSFIGISALISWNIWEKGMGQQRLKDVIRSEDIEILLKGGAFSEKETLAALSKQLSDNLYNSLPKTIFSEKRDANDSNNASDPLEGTFLEGVPGYSRDAVNLALRDILISQGANGIENWRLKAEWATLRQTTSILSMKNPYLLYRTNDLSTKNERDSSLNENKNKTEIEPFKIVQWTKSSDGKKSNSDPNTNNSQKDFFNNSQEMLLITAKNGLIFDNNTKIHLTEDVVARQNDKCVQGDTLNYDDRTKIARFPDFAKFSSTNIEGHALELSWDLANNQLIGSGNIEMTWTQNEKETP